MRLAFLFGLSLFAVGALVAERYGLPGTVTGVTDKGFDKIEGLIAGTERPPAAFAAAAEEPVEDSTQDEASTPAATAALSASTTTDAARNMPTADNSAMSLNGDGLEIIKTSRGLTLSATIDDGDWHIGYAHTATAIEGQTLTVPQAEDLLLTDLEPVQDGVRRMVTVPLNENEYAALVSFAESVGVENFGQTDVYRNLQNGKRDAAAEALSQHTLANVNGELVQMSSLVERRERERALFMTQP
ncbi:lysozyme [Aquisalinus flavus]|uniref:Lysozyme n=1 Tax=Aquisalinus flavus TaxID=1526572 RepID=A0A8J2V1B4_9PROT|nr:lysozyme [Aquisalinus flavus]MBD0426780.1 lysozyme [Aquisalinus flavus]UNE46632.1 lysozyme [Aquisalinus flavus]GGC95933.1 hypothetical protein GCM10011342_00910 [Aquisalinus flavus]